MTFDCTATVGTFHATDRVVSTRFRDSGWQPPVTELPGGMTVKRVGDELHEVDVRENQCNRASSHTGVRDTNGMQAHWHKPTAEEPWFAEWYDDTHGATPHTDPDDPDVCAVHGRFDFEAAPIPQHVLERAATIADEPMDDFLAGLLAARRGAHRHCTPHTDPFEDVRGTRSTDSDMWCDICNTDDHRTTLHPGWESRAGQETGDE